jgi:hypothetical protein
MGPGRVDDARRRREREACNLEVAVTEYID